MYVCMYVRHCTYVYVCIYVCMYAHTHAGTHACTVYVICTWYKHSICMYIRTGYMYVTR